MKLFNVLKPKSIILDESLLTNEFSIGFELEGIANNPDFPDTGLPRYHSQSDVASGGAKKLLDKLNEMLGLGTGHIEHDGSVSPSGNVTTASGHTYNDSTYYNAWGFEYVSPVIQFTPTNIAKISKFLKGLKDIGVVTNKKCGFHTHISYPDINKSDMAWALFCIANDEKMYKEVQSLDEGDYKIDFYTVPYATNGLFANLQNLGEEIKRGSLFKSTRSVNSREKYLMMRVHPQGTLEWRGPRNFINDGSEGKLITDYLKKLHKVIMFIGDVVSRKEYNGFKRNEVLKYIEFEGDFNSSFEKRKESKGKGLIASIEKNPKKILTMSEKILSALFSSSSSAIEELIRYNGELTNYFKNNIDDIDPIALKRVLIHLIKSPADSSEVIRFMDNITSSYDKIAPNVAEDILRELLNKGIVERSSFMLKKFMVHDPKLIADVYKKYKNNSNIFDFLKTNQKYIPVQVFMMIAKDNPSYLRRFERVPTKIQRKLVKGTPYAIQYIRNPDPSVVDYLKTKYGEEINDYILDEV